MIQLGTGPPSSLSSETWGQLSRWICSISWMLITVRGEGQAGSSFVSRIPTDWIDWSSGTMEPPKSLHFLPIDPVL